MNLPEHRQALTGRTTNSTWDPAAYGNPIDYPPTKCHFCDVAFGLAMAIVVMLTIWVLLSFRGPA